MTKSIPIKLTSFFLIIFFTSISFTVIGQRTITGTVKDASSSELLISVNILVKDTLIGTTTDFDGKYSIVVPDNRNTIVFSYVGYTSQEVLLGESDIIDITLTSGEFLDDIVVIGYGTVKKEDLTGSIQAVSAKDFNKGAITSPQELIAGKIPGVTISTAGGPSGGSKIRIRGESSLKASNDPLIIIDGVPLDNSETSGSRNPLNIINPNDIESMTILKDASATAIYGNRASGGVILITTKSGALGDVIKIGYSGNISYSTATNKVDVLNADEFRLAIKDNFEEGHVAHDLVGNADTDWQDEIFQNAFGHDHNLNASGSLGKLPMRASIGYSNKSGILKTDKFKRLTANINLTPKFFDNHLQLKLQAKTMHINNDFANNDAIGAATRFDPTQEILDTDNLNNFGGYTTWIIDANGNPNSLAPTNPVALLELKNDKSTVNRYLVNSNIDYRLHFFPDLRVNLNLAYDQSKSHGTVNIPTFASYSFNEINGGGVNNFYDQKKKNTLFESYLNYNKGLGKSTVDAMAGYSWQHFHLDKSSLDSDVAGTPAESKYKSDPAEYYLVSLFGRVNYNFNKKYFLTFTLRQDGTSRFSPESRWGLFPAAALAVKVFGNENKYFNKLKLRAGWGVTGQQDVDDYYAYLSRYQTSFDNAQYQFGDQFINTIRPNGYDNNIKWEETTTYNIGTDFSLIKNRLSGSFDLYQRNTKDLLNRIPVPAGTNLTNFITTNVGNMESKGFEISLITTPWLTKNNSWDFAVNLAYNDSKITKLTATEDKEYQGILVGGISGGVGSNIQIHSVGYSPFTFFVFEQLYNEDGTIIEGEFADRNGDGEITEADKYRYQNPSADYTLGFSSSLNLSDFTFSFAGRTSIGNYVYNNLETDQGYTDRLYGTTNYIQNIHQSAIDNNIEKQNNITFSDHYVQKASYLKIDNIRIAYNLNKLVGYGLNVHFTVQNAIVVSKYNGLDPEISNTGYDKNKGDGIDNNIYPRSRSFIFGLSMNISTKKKK